MKFLDLFAGIGGFRSGLEKAGHKCVGYVEIDEFARKSYQAIYDTKGEYTEHDIRKIDTTNLPEADIWTFGFPCQDISVAGKQKGFAGERSSLFFAVTGKLRQLKDEQKPSYLLIENVKNLLSINGGRDFGKLQIELDEIGYDVEWDVLDTAEVLPQHRERVYIVGHFRGRGTRNVFPITRKGEPTSDERQKINIIGTTKPASSTRLGQRDVVYDSNGLMGTLGATDYKQPKQIAVCGGGLEPKLAIREATKRGYAEGYEGDSINISQPNSKTRRGRVDKQRANTLETGLNQGVIESDLRIRKLTPLETWRLQGFTDEQFYKAQAVNSNSQLYKQAGNSVSVPVVYEVAKHLMINA